METAAAAAWDEGECCRGADSGTSVLGDKDRNYWFGRKEEIREQKRVDFFSIF